MLAWIDLEMTGLEPSRHVIVEIASLVTDDDLTIVAEGPDLVVHATSEQLAEMDDFVIAMHTRSGLLGAIEESTLSLEDAGAQTLEFLKLHIPDAGTVPLAGNSIGTDRRFLAAQLPEIEDYLALPLGGRLDGQGALPSLVPRHLQVGAREEGWAPRPSGHPRERGGARVLSGCRLQPRTDHPSHATGRMTSEKDAPRTPDDNQAASMSVAEADATLTAPGQLFEMLERDIRGISTRTWKNAPETLRTVLDLSFGHGDNTFLVYEDERTSFAEHYRIACTLAHRLKDEFSIAPGDRVAIAMRNLPEWVMAFWAISLTGAIVVPLNAWWSGEELRYGLEDSGSKIAFVDMQRAETIRPFLGGLPRLHIADRGRRAP